MAQKEALNLVFSEMAEMREKRVQDFVSAQTEMINCKGRGGLSV
jgi:hypothetical protein